MAAALQAAAVDRLTECQMRRKLIAEA